MAQQLFKHILQPTYSPELNSTQRNFEEWRQAVEGAIYATLEARDKRSNLNSISSQVAPNELIYRAKRKPAFYAADEQSSQDGCFRCFHEFSLPLHQSP